MKTSHAMTREVVVVSPAVGVPAARRLMERLNIRHLLVVADGKLLGIVSDRALLDYGPDEPGTCGQVMTSSPLTCAPDMPVHQLATMMIAHRIRLDPAGPRRQARRARHLRRSRSSCWPKTSQRGCGLWTFGCTFRRRTRTWKICSGPDARPAAGVVSVFPNVRPSWSAFSAATVAGARREFASSETAQMAFSGAAPRSGPCCEETQRGGPHVLHLPERLGRYLLSPPRCSRPVLPTRGVPPSSPVSRRSCWVLFPRVSRGAERLVAIGVGLPW